MESEIRTLPPRKYVMVERKGRVEGVFVAGPEAYNALQAYIERSGLGEKIDKHFGVAPDVFSDVPDSDQRYWAGAFLRDGATAPAEEGVMQGTWPGGRTAVFRYQGGYEGLGDAWGSVYDKGLSAIGAKPSDAVPYEVYVTMEGSDPEGWVTELCVPVL